MVDSEDRYSTEKASSVQSTILYDCEVEALSKSVRPSQSYSPTIKWRCRPELVQIHGFRSVKVLLDTPPGSLKKCPEAKGGSVRVQIIPSRPVSVFIMKPRLCPSRDQSSPAASHLEHCELVLCEFHLEFRVPVIFKDSVVAGGRTIWSSLGQSPGCDVDTTGPMPYTLDYDGFKETPYSLDREDSDERGHVLWLSITRRCNVAVTRRTVGCRADIADREEEHEVTRAQVLTLSPKSGLGLESRLRIEAASSLSNTRTAGVDFMPFVNGIALWVLLARFDIRPDPVLNYFNVRRDELVEELVEVVE
ncbi:hypothetical protein YC2023_040594 [Brassica napus]